MALAKTPKQLETEADVRRAEESDGEGPQHMVTVESPSDVITLRNTLRGWHWIGYNKVFQILEILAPTDRAFERARKQVLDVANDQERAMAMIVNRVLIKEPGKEQGNGK